MKPIRWQFVPLLAIMAAVALATSACAPAAPPPPTSAPATPTKAAEPTKTPAPVAPTAAPAAQLTAVPTKTVDFPQKGKTITLIVPMAPGGGSDTGARALAVVLEKELGTPVQVVNKPGAGGQTGATEFALAKPDGYTLLYAAVQSIETTYLDPERKAAYSRASFAPVARVTADPTNLAVRADGPFKSLKDLVDTAKAKPGEVKVAASGIMSVMHLPVLMLEDQAGVRFGVVHFDGGKPGVTALLGGHVDAASAMTVDSGPNAKSGDLRILAVAGPEEIKQLPGVKTFEAQGYKIQTVVSNMMAAPAGTPKEVVDILSKAVQKSLQNADLQKRLDGVGLTPGYLDPTQFAAFWDQSDKDIAKMLDLFNTIEKK